MTVLLYDIPNDFFLGITAILGILAAPCVIVWVHYKSPARPNDTKAETENRVTFNGLRAAKLLTVILLVRTLADSQDDT